MPREAISKAETEEDVLELILLGLLCKKKLNPEYIISFNLEKCIIPENIQELKLAEDIDLSKVGYLVEYRENLERFNKEDLYDAFLAGKLDKNFNEFYNDKTRQ